MQTCQNTLEELPALFRLLFVNWKIPNDWCDEYREKSDTPTTEILSPSYQYNDIWDFWATLREMGNKTELFENQFKSVPVAWNISKNSILLMEIFLFWSSDRRIYLLVYYVIQQLFVWRHIIMADLRTELLLKVESHVSSCAGPASRGRKLQRWKTSNYGTL